MKWPGSPDAEPPRCDITNLHPSRRVDTSRVRQLVLGVLRSENRAYQCVDLVLLDGDSMRDYNRRFHGMDESTDHLGFQYEAPAGRVSGDIFVCLDEVARQASEYGTTFRRELGKVVVHGVLHLCGWSDGTAARRRRMHAREEELLDGIDAASPLGRWLGGGL